MTSPIQSATQAPGPTVAPAPTQPAAPPVLIQQANSLWAFITDHWGLAAIAAVAVTMFFVLPKFQEIAYGQFRVAVAILTISLIVYAWFRHTVREYLVSGAFVAEFRALKPEYRVAATLAILYIISRVVTECIVHP